MIRPAMTLGVRPPITQKPVQKFQEIDDDKVQYYVKIYDDITLLTKDYLLLSYLRLFHLAPAVYGIKANKTNNRFYILMERMDGAIGAYKTRAFSREFTDILARQSPEEIAFNMKKVIDTVKAAHSVGLIHGDLCLPNIVYKLNGDGSLDFKLIDFDYSTFYHQSLNRYNQHKNCLGEYSRASAPYELNKLFNQLHDELINHFAINLEKDNYDIPREQLSLLPSSKDLDEDRAKNITIFNSILEDFKNNPLITTVLTSYATRNIPPINIEEEDSFGRFFKTV